MTNKYFVSREIFVVFTALICALFKIDGLVSIERNMEMQVRELFFYKSTLSAVQEPALFTWTPGFSANNPLSPNKLVERPLLARKAVAEQLEKLTELESEYLDNFFAYIIRISTFGYVFYGDKPMSIESFDNVASKPDVEGIDYMDDEHLLDKYRFKEGWEVWKKIEHQFSLPNHSFLSYVQPENKNAIEIACINNRAFLKVVDDHLDDFHRVLGAEATSEEIFKDYLHQGPFFSIIRGHDGLFGTLLGFGRDNAWTFYESNDEGKKSLSIFADEDLEKIKLAILPRFAVRPNNPENERLKIKYSKQRNQFEPRYSKGHYSFVTLTHLLSIE